MAIFIAPTASVMGRVFISKDVSVWYGAVIRADVEEIHLGEGCNIQDNAVLHADEGDKTIIGPHVTVGHGAIVHGAEIGEGSLVGMQATVLNRAKVGKFCLIGAHVQTVCTEGFPCQLRVQTKGLSLFFAIHILRDRLAHQPMRSALTRLS